MILIADSGSTKTDWRLLAPNGTVSQAKTIGFNPYYQDAENIYSSLEGSLLPQLTGQKPTEIFFYGAGCGSEDKRNVVAEALRQAFPGSEVTVQHDLAAAARALCGHSPGIACILGTGSNSCLYDGKEIVQNIPPLGFILGDEGSGAYLGRKLIQAFLREELPADLRENFAKRYKVTKEAILDWVYSQPFPNRYLASFAKYAFDKRRHPAVYPLIRESFSDFFEKHVCRYPGYIDLPVHFVGSIAFYFGDILRQLARERQVRVQHILESPIAGLTLYHQQELL
jgi:glucosamine kinase